jgi:hypothetical protein
MGVVLSKYEHPPSFEYLERRRRNSAPGRLESHICHLKSACDYADTKEDIYRDDSSSHIVKDQLRHDLNKESQYHPGLEEPMLSMKSDARVFANHGRDAKQVRHGKTRGVSGRHLLDPSLPAHEAQHHREPTLDVEVLSNDDAVALPPIKRARYGNKLHVPEIKYLDSSTLEPKREHRGQSGKDILMSESDSVHAGSATARSRRQRRGIAARTLTFDHTTRELRMITVNSHDPAALPSQAKHQGHGRRRSQVNDHANAVHSPDVIDQPTLPTTMRHTSEHCHVSGSVRCSARIRAQPQAHAQA